LRVGERLGGAVLRRDDRDTGTLKVLAFDKTGAKPTKTYRIAYGKRTGGRRPPTYPDTVSSYDD
jgi:hypothetical protein